MIALIVLCLAVSSIAAPNSYGSYSAPAIRVEQSYAAPALKIEAPRAYAAPALKIEAPKAYAAPAIRVEAPAYSSYSAPMRVAAYETPVVLKKAPIPIVSFVKTDDNYGTMSLSHTSGDGTQMNEETHLKNLGDVEGPVSVKSGSYSWLSPEGKTFSVSYTADENGFQASGAHFPVAPIDEHHRNLPLAAAPASYGHY